MKILIISILQIALVLFVLNANAQKSCTFVSLNQVEIEDANDTTISGYFRINDYMLTADGAVKFGLKAEFSSDTDFKYVKLYADSLCTSSIMSLDPLISTTEPNKIEGNFTYNFHECDTTIRVFLKFRLFNFTEYIYALDVELRSVVGVDSQYGNESLKIFPNPVSNTLNIVSKKSQNKQLYNSLGDLLLETDANTIDLSGLSSGLYFLKVNGSIYKFIKK